MRGTELVVLVLAVAACSCEMRSRAPSDASAPGEPARFVRERDLTWTRIIPDLGARSPEMAIVHVDPATQATQLMIRTPAAIHIRPHWHTANETHSIIRGTAIFECDGQRAELAPGSYNFMPARMVHQAWLPANSLAFITVDRAWDVNWVEGPPTAADLMPTRTPRQRKARRPKS